MRTSLPIYSVLASLSVANAVPTSSPPLQLRPTPPASQDSQAVSLGSAASFGALSGSAGITNTGATDIGGDLGTTGVSITGFPPGTITGTEHIGDTTADTAQTDANLAYASAAGAPAGTVLSSSDLTGQTLYPGTYTFPTVATLNGALYLAGNASSDGIFIFQLGTALSINGGSSVTLEDGASACNVFWQVGSSATLGVGVSFVGYILAYASVVAKTGASVTGGLFANTASITLDTNAITVPVC